MRVLLTGSTGFIGRHAGPLLLEKGYEVHTVSSRKNEADHQCNLLDAIETKALVQKVKPTHLLHFAWVTTPGLYLSSPENITWVEASLRLVEAFVEAGGKRVVVAGSCAEYEPKALCSETDNGFQSSTLYGRSKRELCLQLEKLKVELAWGYLFYLYGPYENPKRFLPSLIRGILEKKEVHLTEGTQIRDFLHVKDAARGFVELLDSSLQGCFNIASGKGISIREMVEVVVKEIGGEEWLKFGARPLSPFDPPELVANMELLQKEIPWRPTLDLNEGLKEVIGWWRCQ